MPLHANEYQQRRTLKNLGSMSALPTHPNIEARASNNNNQKICFRLSSGWEKCSHRLFSNSRCGKVKQRSLNDAILPRMGDACQSYANFSIPLFHSKPFLYEDLWNVNRIFIVHSKLVPCTFRWSLV